MKIIQSVCLWQDLLGYGKPFYQSNWDLNQPCAQKNIQRIKNLETELKRVPIPLLEKVLFLNDGMVKNVDISTKKDWDYVEFYIMWLENAIKQFYRINRKDKQQNNPGLRGVLTIGHRTQYTNELVKMGELVNSKDGDYNKQIVVYSPNEFQMNTAFSKAFIMEEGGTKKGVSGAFLFIDKAFIDFFVQMINDSEPIKSTKLNDQYQKGDRVTTENTTSIEVEYHAKLQEKNNTTSLCLYIELRGECIEYKRVMFEREPIRYMNESANLHTDLYKTIGFWSIEDGHYLDLSY